MTGTALCHRVHTGRPKSFHIVTYIQKEETEEEKEEEEEEGDGSGQNKDERLFSLIGRNTGPQSRNIKIETIEKQGRHSANSCEKA